MGWIFQNFLPFIVLITVLVFVHEWGHFWVARRCGVRVTRFAIGFGPEIFGWTDRKNTRWSFCAIPMGGYIKMLGDGDASSTTKVDVADSEKQETLESKTPQQRIAVASAGPLANFIFAWFLLVALMCWKGAPIVEPVVQEVQAGSLAEQYGIVADDRITHIDDEPVSNFNDLKISLYEKSGKNIVLSITRNNEVVQKDIPLYTLNEETGEKVPQKKLGIIAAPPVYKPYSFLKAVPLALQTIFDMCADMLRSIGMMLTSSKSGEVGGLLAIGDMASQSVQHGITAVIWFLIVLSVNLGLINLFPIPVLDGGHIFLNIIELIRKKPLSEQAQGYAYKFGFILLISLMVYANWNDFVRYGITKFIKQIFGF